MVDIGSPLISYGQAPEAIEPREGAFYHPSMAAELFLAFDALAGDARQNTALAAGFATTRVIISLIGMALAGAPLWAARLAANRWDGVQHVLKHHTVMYIGASQLGCERNAAPVGHKMPFRPRLAAIRWIWARGRPPFFAGMDDESTQTRLKSIRLALRRRRSNSCCNRSQTPASCQSRSRRQQVTPEPQPSSGGKSSHAMPVRSTNRIPLSAARSQMRGLPPRGFGAGGGRSFSMIGQRPSGIRTEGIPSYESAIPRRTRVLKGGLSKESSSFLKKRTKKLLLMGLGACFRRLSQTPP